MKEITIKEGDVINVTAFYFQVPNWTDDQPCVILSPVVQYLETNSAESAVEDFLIDLCSDECAESDDLEDVEEALQWVGKSLSCLRKKANLSIKTGKSPYKNSYSEIISLQVKITKDEDGLDWEEISRKEINNEI